MKDYMLKIDLNVLNHLGLNLYSNVPAVLAELIANAWDADASTVRVTIKGDKEEKQIIVQDDGCGMDEEDLSEKFLTIGYQRRGSDQGQDGDRTPIKERPVMGRKGIGKLSAFSIAKKIQVVTRKKNADPTAIELDVEKIREAIEKQQDYHPPAIKPPDDITLGESGTAMVLGKLQKRTNASLDRHLRQRVARRFSVISGDFKVFISGKEVTIEDRNYLKQIEFALVYGDFDSSSFEKGQVVERDSTLESSQLKYAVKGWIGLVEKSGDLQSAGDNLNKISVLARGKVALEDILDSYREGGLYTKYVIGELEADFLDLTEQDDIATSSRQDFIQSDDRFIQLSNFVAKELKHLAKERAKFKTKKGGQRLLKFPRSRSGTKISGEISEKLPGNFSVGSTK